MNLPFTINKYFTSTFSKEQIDQEIQSSETAEIVVGPGKDDSPGSLAITGFRIGYTPPNNGSLFIERLPPIEGYYAGENPLTLNIIIKPDYLSTWFCFLLSLAFVLVGLFGTLTVNGHTTANWGSRILFCLFVGGIPALYGYFFFIRPLYKAEKWVIEKFCLNKV